MAKREKKEESEQYKNSSSVKPRIVADYTSASLKGVSYPPISEFEWPKTKTESERIMKNTEKYRSVDIRTAFEETYGMKIKKSLKKDVFIGEYGDVKVGDVIQLRIKSVDKKGAHFYSDNFKEEIVCAVNLFQYKKFKEVIPIKHVDCKVVSRTENTITVDPLAPLYDEWLKNKITNINNQKDINNDRSVLVKDLKLIRSNNMSGGGYYGAIRIDSVSDFLGQDVFIKCFIPGSHIVLNIEHDFERWNGKETRAFITNYISDKGNDHLSLICSAKEYQAFLGDKNKINLFKEYTEETDKWEKELEKVYDGRITGVLNSSKKCGVFVEVPDLHITTFVPRKADELVNYRKNTNCKVQWDHFEEPVKYNEIGQLVHITPYVIDNDIIKKCFIKTIFKFAE